MKSKIKLIIQKIVRVIGRIFYRKHLWLVADREWEAGDNGEAFFRYLQSQPVNSAFAIQKSSKDYERMKAVGKVVDYDSLKFKFLLCVADIYISSHDLHMAGHKETPQFFLSHGISYRDLHVYFNSMAHENYYTIVASKIEKDNIGRPPYKIIPEHIFITGYPRYDRLEQAEDEHIITIAFTWRSFMWNMTKDAFVNSEYYKVYSSIFDNKELLDIIESKGYKIKLKMHPRMEMYKDVLSLPQGITLWEDSVTYKEIFEKSSLMITDYSSAVFDLAYLNKPVVYYQPDYAYLMDNSKEQYEYDYESKGIGDVSRSIGDLEKCLSYYMNNGCKMKEEYSNRISEFFEYHDKHNCERVYKVINSIIG